MVEEQTKKDNKLKYWVIGIIAVILLIILIFMFSDKPISKEKLTDEDFKILSASWEEYQRRTNNEFSPVKMDWNKLCLGEYGTDYLSAAYTIITQQTEELICNYILNGVEQKKEGTMGWGFERDKNIYRPSYNLNFKQDNDITICCISQNIINKEGKICKSIILPAKC